MDYRYLTITTACTVMLLALGFLELKGVIRKPRSLFAATFDFFLVLMNLWAMYMHIKIWS